MPNNKMKIKSNSVANSVKTVEHKVIKFSDLWDSYPSNIHHKDPKMNSEIFSDRCAIKVSQALYANGVLMNSFVGVRCWQCPTPNAKGKGVHAIRAQELADYLYKKPFAGCPNPIEVSAVDFDSALSGKEGIIFFQDYWQRKGEKNRTGDHIDLWDGNELASIGYFFTQARLLAPSFAEQYLSMSDLRKATKVIFWDMTQ